MTSPAGCISKVEEQLKESLSKSGTFQTLVSAGDAAAAKASIYYEDLADPADNKDSHDADELETYRPYAVVFIEPGGNFGRREVAVGTFASFGRVSLLIVRTAENSPNRGDGDLDWLNVVGQILEDLEQLSETAGCLKFVESTIRDGPGRRELDEAPGQGEEQGARIDFQFGPTR